VVSTVWGIAIPQEVSQNLVFRLIELEQCWQFAGNQLEVSIQDSLRQLAC